MKIDVLGATYEIIEKPFGDEFRIEEEDNFCEGLCYGLTHTILLCDPATIPAYRNESEEFRTQALKATLRHEIVHAFLNESGLECNAMIFDKAWPKNEEMIDWIARQGPKLYAAWQAAGAL